MKILQADDHDLFRDGMRYILAGIADELEVLQSADFFGACLHLERHPDIELVLLDLNMPGMRGTQGLGEIVKAHPTVPVVVLSASAIACDIETALDMGAAGYVPKSSSSDVLLAALKLVLAGGVYVPRVQRGSFLTDRHAGPATELTKRQREILACVAEGMPNKEIANHLFLSESTIKGHVRAVLHTLQVQNRVQAINKAREMGQLSQISS